MTSSRRIFPGRLALLLVAAAGVQGCTTSGCTLVGGESGVFLEIARALDVKKGLVHVEVCDDYGCATATQPQGGRAAFVTFDDLGRDYDAGPVTVEVELADGRGTVVARTRRTVELTRSYPNGKRCDGEGYVNGELVLRRSDRV